MIDNRQVGRKIAAMRQAKALTQQQLAVMMNVSHQAVSKWESGQALPDIQTLLELTHFFGVTVEQLISPQEEKVAVDAYAGGDGSDTNPEEEKEEPREPKEVKNMNIQQLLQMAPYMSKETVEEIVIEINDTLSAAQIARIAPYIRAECLEKLIEKHHPEFTWESLRRIAPYMRRESVDELARAIASGRESVKPNTDKLDKTINDISKAFDDIGRGVGKAVKKAIRFGESVIDEVSSAFSDFNADCQHQPEQASAGRSERAAALRKMAFERALVDGKWDWIADHMDEIEGDTRFREKLAARAREENMHDWICRNLGEFAGGDAVEAAIARGDWEWLSENACKQESVLQQRIIQAAADAQKWDWIASHSDQMLITPCALQIALNAYEKGEKALAVQLAGNQMEPAQVSALAQKAYESNDLETIASMQGLLEDGFLNTMLSDMADKGAWEQTERFLADASPETIEVLMEKAVAQGDFDAVDLLDDYL